MKKFCLVLLILTVLANSNFAEYYAVIITGDTPNLEALGEKTYNGGSDEPQDEFWNDTFLMWETLWNFGWKDDNIYVLFGDDEDWDTDNDWYDASQKYGTVWGFEEITDDSAYYEDVIQVFDHLDSVMTDDDFLFLYTFDHGYYTIDNDIHNSWLQLMGEEDISDETLAEIMPAHYDKRVIWMAQCCSGGFVNDLEDSNTVILTAVDSVTIAWGANDGNRDFRDTLACEVVDDSLTFHHSEFSYHVMNAARQKTVYYGNISDSADLNSDGYTSLYEIFEWEDFKDRFFDPPHNPQYSDIGDIGDDIFLNIPPYPPDSLELEDVNNQVHLTWVRNQEYDLMRYRIFRLIVTNDSSANQYILIDSVGANTLEYTDPEFDPGGGEDGAAYYLTAVDSAWQESSTSDTVMSHGDYIEGQGGASAASLIAGDYGLNVNPNPFNSSTTIRFALPHAGWVTLDIFDITGRSVGVQNFEPLHQWMSAGSHSVTFDGSALASGIYFARLQAGEYVKTQKLLLLK